MNFWSSKLFFENGRYEIRQNGNVLPPLQGMAVQVYPLSAKIEVCLRVRWKPWHEVRESKQWARTRADKKAWVERIVSEEKAASPFFALYDYGFDIIKPFDWSCQRPGSVYISTYHCRDIGVTAKFYLDGQEWFANLFLNNEPKMSAVPIASVLGEARKLAGWIGR